MALKDPARASLPFSALLLGLFDRALRRVARCRRPLYISLDTIGLLCELCRITPARHRDLIRAKTPNAKHVRKLAASHLAARAPGSSTPGHAARSQQLANRRATVKRIASELDAYWLAAQCSADRASRRLLRPYWFKAHAKGEPQTRTLRDLPGEPADGGDPPVLPSRNWPL